MTRRAVVIAARISAAALSLACGAQSPHDADAAATTSPVASLPPLQAHPTVALTFDDLAAASTLPSGDTRTQIMRRLAAELNANRMSGAYAGIPAVYSQTVRADEEPLPVVS